MKSRFPVFAAPLALVVAGVIGVVGARHFYLARSLALKRPDAGSGEHQKRLLAQDLALVRGLKGQLKRIALPPSKLLGGRSLTAWVYLPPGYDTGARFPVAYILHGSPGGVRDAFVNAGVHRVAERMILQKQIQPMILVGWDASGPRGFADPVFYLDRRDGRYQMESWMLRELVPWVDGHFKTLAWSQSRALIGFSAGGFGAANLGLKHPDVFRVMASHAGFFDPGDDVPVMKSILGPRSKLWDDNSPIQLARRVPRGMRLHFYLDCGRSDPLLGEFQKMKSELRARHIDFEAHVFAGAHDWKFLHAHYFDSLRFCDQRFRELANEPDKKSAATANSLQ